MKTSEITEGTAIVQEKLVGTKWIGWSEFIRDRISVEFIDRTNCIYTSQPKKYPMTYTVTGGKMFIKNIEGSFELRGEVLFNNDLPIFEKVA